MHGVKAEETHDGWGGEELVDAIACADGVMSMNDDDCPRLTRHGVMLSAVVSLMVMLYASMLCATRSSAPGWVRREKGQCLLGTTEWSASH